jgi:hypothetical protein
MFMPLVCAAIKSDPHVFDGAMMTHTEILLNSLDKVASSPQPLLIVIDALDECEPGDNDDGVYVVRTLINTIASFPSFKLFVTSRMERNIQKMLTSDDVGALQRLLHYDIETHITSSDIHLYLERKFSELAKKRQLELPFPLVEDLDKLVKRAGTLFIYAATVFRYIAETEESPVTRMGDLLNQTPSEDLSPCRALDRLYAHIIAEAAKSDGNPEPHEHALRMFLSTMMVIQQPLTVASLANLVGIREENMKIILKRLSPIMLVEKDACVHLYHPSFSEFIIEKGGYQHKKYPAVERFLVIPSEVHIHLAHRCLQTMNGHLRQDICNIRDASLLNNYIPNLNLKLARVAPLHLRYACKFWPVHLRLASRLSEEVMNQLRKFVDNHLLHWLEISSLMGEVIVVQREVPALLAFFNVSYLIVFIECIIDYKSHPSHLGIGRYTACHCMRLT